MITSIVAVRHYGVVADRTYNDQEDKGQPRERNCFTGVYQVKKVSLCPLKKPVYDLILPINLHSDKMVHPRWRRPSP